MKGLSIKVAKAIEELIENRFNTVSLPFLGLIPKLSREKKIVFSTNRNSLTSLFLQALNSRVPNKNEEDSLKIILRVANGYVDALRSRTKSTILHSVNAYVRNQNNDKQGVDPKQVTSIIQTEMDKAKNHFKMIANVESNRAINVGTALQITKIAEQKGIDDPLVFFIVTVDDVTCSECKRLHLLPDLKTPRIWKLSEIGHEYHKKGDPNPKIAGLHPNCRCKITYLAPNWGFNEKGNVQFKGLKWDEYKHQRSNFKHPPTITKKKKKK